jgi:hypothetical protein
MADASYAPKVYKKDGGNTLVVASGGTLSVESGGTLTYNGTTVSGGSVVANDITGGDSTLDITGLAGSSSNGGRVLITAGAGDSTNTGGAASLVGGGSGNGATGNGGAVSATGGAALSTAGNGGAASLVGGVATTTGTGGAVTITGGASAGASGTAGSVNINPGAAAGGTAGAINLGNTNACNVVVGASSFFKLPQTAITTEGFIWYDTSSHTVKYRDNSGTKTITAS